MLSYLAALGLPAEHTPPGVLLAKSSADDCGEYCSPAATVHGDPMFKANGTSTHFWLKEGELTPLIQSGDVIISGRTFNRKDTGHQWFDQFVISNKAKAVIEVTIEDGQTIYKLDGKVVKNHVLTVSGETEAIDGKIVPIGKHSAEGAEMEFADKGINAVAGDLTVNIYPSDASKFKSGKDKQRYEHLNIGFLSGIPRRAKGIFAELSGVQAMSEATTALLRQPKGAVALMQRAHQGVCPPGCVPRVPKEKYIYFGGSNGECTYQDKDGIANVFAEDNAQLLKGQPRDQYALPTGDAELVLQAVSGTDVGLLYSRPINFGTSDATKAAAHKRAQIICNADPDCLGYGSDTHAIDRWYLVSLSNRGEGPWTEKECMRQEPDDPNKTYKDTCTFDEAKAELDVGLHTFPALDCESEIVIPIQGAGPTTDTSRRKQLDRESNNCGDEDTETGCWVKFVEKEVLDPADATKPPTKVIEKYVFDPTREIEYEDGPSLSELLRQARAHKAEYEKKVSRLSEQKEKVYYVPE